MVPGRGEEYQMYPRIHMAGRAVTTPAPADTACDSHTARDGSTPERIDARIP